MNGLNEIEDEPSDNSEFTLGNDSIEDNEINYFNYEPTSASIVRELKYYKKDHLFDISNKSSDEIKNNMIKNEIIDFKKLSIMKEIQLFDKIAEIYKGPNQSDILNQILFNIKFDRIKTPKEIYQKYVDTCIRYNSKPDNYNETQYKSLSDIDKLKYLTDLIYTGRYLMLNIDPKVEDFISDFDFFRNGFILINLRRFDNIFDMDVLIYLYYNNEKEKYKEYLFTNEEKNKIIKFINKNGNGNVDQYYSSYIDDIYNMNINNIKKNMNIKPMDLFKEDILSLNKNISDDLIESLYKEHIPSDLRYIYILKANRICFMAKYKNIIYGLNLDDNLFVDKSKIIKTYYRLTDYTVIEENKYLDLDIENINPESHESESIKKEEPTIEKMNENAHQNKITATVEQQKFNEIITKQLVNEIDEYRKIKTTSNKRELKRSLFNKFAKRDYEDSYNRYKKFKDDFDIKVNNTINENDKPDTINKKGTNSK